jgi:hypothetical protein
MVYSIGLDYIWYILYNAGSTCLQLEYLLLSPNNMLYFKAVNNASALVMHSANP